MSSDTSFGVRLIDAEDLLTAFPAWEDETFHTCAVRETIKACKTIDAVPVVRCNECKYAEKRIGNAPYRCTVWFHSVNENDFCSAGVLGEYED